MKRNIAGCLALIIISFAFAIFLCYLDYSIAKKEKQLNEIYDNLNVECIVTNLTGTQTDNLNIKDYIVSLFFSDESYFQGKKDEIPFSFYFKELKIKSSLKYEIITESQDVFISDIYKANDLIGLTHISADKLLAPENNIDITYFYNYSEDIFLTDEAVCIVSEGLYKTLQADSNGKYYLSLAVGDPRSSESKYVMQRLQVAGIYEGDSKNIYCPWDIIMTLSKEITGLINADSLSCIIKDNRQIETVKNLLLRYFAEVDITGTAKSHTASDILINYEYAIIVHDDIFYRTVSKIENDINILKIMNPIIIALSLGIGFLASFLFVRNRKHEFAIMRSLGSRKSFIFLEAFLEQVFLGLIGIGLGLISCKIWSLCIDRPPLVIICAFFLSYLTGSSIVVYRFVNKKVMTIMKERD